MKNSVLVSLALLVSGTAYAQFDSLNVRFVGNWPFGPSYAVAHDSTRNLVFLGSGGGVYILDGSNPGNHVRLSDAIRTRGVVEDLFFDSSLQDLYIVDGVALEIWDVSSSESPVKLGSYDTPGPAENVHVSGSFAYVAGRYSGLRIIDISIPSNPQEVGYYDASVRDVYVSDIYAYVTCYQSLCVVDVSNPSNPHEVGLCETLSWAAGDLYVSGSNAYVSDGYKGLGVIDVSMPSNPHEISYFDTPNSVRKVYVSGHYAYIADTDYDEENALRVIDISTPSELQEVGHYDISGWPYGIYVSGTNAYVADGDLHVIDVSTPSTPQEVGYYDAPNWAVDVYLSDAYAYVVNGNLHILDVSSPSNPQEVGYCDTPLSACDVYVSGHYAYVIDANYGLRVIDVSTSSDPQEVGSYDMPDGANDVYVSGSFAYIATDSGLRVIDVLTPSDPQEVGFFDTPGRVQEVCVSGTNAYVADGDLRVIDVSTPSTPQEVGHWGGDHNVYDVYGSVSYAYVVADTGDLHVIDVSTPSNPQKVGYCFLYLSRDVHVLDPYAYVVSDMGFAGLAVIDISTPSDPEMIGYYETPGEALGISVLDTDAYVADGAAGLQIYENIYTGVEETPIHTASTIRLTTMLNRLAYDVPDQAQLTLYSADGRMVLEETVEGQGIWDAPAELPQGVYFARIENDSGSARTKLVVLR